MDIDTVSGIHQPSYGASIPDVNITNILATDPADLAKWVATRLLNLRLPIPGPNHTLNLQGEILPILPAIANRISFATELYVQCAGAKPGWTKAKKNPDTKEAAEDALAVLNSHMDCLYRAIQTLESQRESASRLITGANSLDKMYRYGT